MSENLQDVICSANHPSAGGAVDEQNTPSAGGTQGLCKAVIVKLTPPQTARQFEAALRDLGYSRRLAKRISQHGYRATLSEPIEAATVELSAAVKNILAVLKN